MPCPEFEDRLLSREELSAAERESVDAHLEVLSRWSWTVGSSVDQALATAANSDHKSAPNREPAA